MPSICHATMELPSSVGAALHVNIGTDYTEESLFQLHLNAHTLLTCNPVIVFAVFAILWVCLFWHIYGLQSLEHLWLYFCDDVGCSCCVCTILLLALVFNRGLCLNICIGRMVLKL